MAGYTRQSTGSIINGSPITAPPLNTEFNQLQSAFNATGGHTHTGGTGDAPKINLATSVTGFLPAANGGMGGQNKMDATTTPVVTNDNTEGFAPGSLWENTTTGRIYICVGSSTGAAVWRELLQVQNGNAVLPAATDTVDLGSNSVRFQDLFLSAGIAAAGNATIGGTLNVTAATALGSTLGVTGDTTLVNLAATGTTTITSIDLNSGAIDNTTIGTTTPAAGTFTTLNANTSLVAATADINGGTVDGATIGASTPSTGAFTDLDASGTATLATVDINAGAIDGTAIGASSHTTGKFTTLQSTGQATLATADINGGTIDGATVGATTASSGAFTTLTASGGITGALTGNVTGNVTGSLSGGTVTGNVTGDLTGNVTAGSGSSSFNDVTISGTLNMDANSAATITNLSAPTNDNDAARKIDVDNAVANLVDSAPDSLNTLNELAAALADDDDAFNTLNTSIGTKLPKSGGTMTGAIAMSTNKITGVGDPTAAQDVSSKAYTDAQRDTRVAKSGDSMSGNLAMGSNNITGLATPTANDHAVNKSYADNILGSSTAAATSASNAATSESNAATSETNAANSATAAAGSATSAAASLDSFDDRYLGAKSSAPTVDNDGDALIVGALYFDSTAGAMKVYSANGWTNAGSSVNGTSDRQTYIVTTDGQTVFAATYDAGYIDVYLNGVKQLMGTDVTATNGTSVVFASGTAINDIVDIVAYGTFVLADHLTQTQSDARYVNLSGDTMTGALNVSGTGVVGTFSSSNNNTVLRVKGNGATNGGAIGSTSSDDLVLLSGLTEKMRITSSGDVAFSGSSGTTGTIKGRGTITISDDHGDNTGGAVTLHYAGNGGYSETYIENNNTLVFNADPTQAGSNTSIKFRVDDDLKAMIDASGNFLVNHTSITDWPTTAGAQVRGTGYVIGSVDGDYPFIANRLTSDGEIMQFRKDGSTVGSIGNSTTNLLINSTSGSGLFFGSGTIAPMVSGSLTGNSIDIGTSSYSYKDLYLSGGVKVSHNSTVWDGIKGSNLGYGSGSYKVTQVGETTGINNIALGVDLSGNTSGSFTGYRDIFVSNDAGLYQPNSTNDGYHHLMGWDDNETVFNDSGNNRDFRVESDNNANCFKLDAGADEIYLGKGSGAGTAVGGIIHAKSNRFYQFLTETSTNAEDSIMYLNRQSSDGKVIFFRRANSSVGSITVSTSGTTYNTTSDRRLKDNIEPIANGTEKLMAMKPVTHTWIADPEADAVHGFIAQEMQEIIPEAVSGDPDGEEMMSMDYGRITPVLVAALQEATNEIKALKERVAELEAK